MFKGLTDFFKDSKRVNNHFHHELPYRLFDDKTNVFLNKGSSGCGFKLDVLGGANDDLVESLNKFIMELPQGNKWDYHIALVGNNQVSNLIENNEVLMSKRGGICARLAQNETKYAKFAAHSGFMHRQKHHFDLRDHHAYFFVSTTSNEQDDLIDTKAAITTTLSSIGFNFEPITPTMLIRYVSEILNFNKRQERPIQVEYNEFEPLNTQMLSRSSEFLLSRKHTDTRYVEDDRQINTRIINLGLRKLPNDFRLYGLPECISSLRNVAQSIPCPYLLTLNFKVDETGKVTSENDRKIGSLLKTVETKMKLLIPTAEGELAERKDIQQSLIAKSYGVASMVLTLTLFSDAENDKKHVQAAKGAFSSGGLDIIPLDMLQGQSLLAILPFMMLDGYWKDCKLAGRIRTMKTSNLANFFPIILDNKNFSGGMLLPTMRQQVSFLDPFNCGSDNYNIAVTGGSGAGKSFFMQQLVKSVYSKFGKVWILDKGGSYKKLTLMLEGTYMTPSQIFLNPFTYLGDISSEIVLDDEGNELNPMALVLDNITALFATIASPTTELDAFQHATLGDAILKAFDANGAKTLVDDVQQALFDIAKELGNDRRISDIATQLNKFCSKGIYGSTFNKPSMLNPDVHITTLELDGFPDAVLRPVIFALMVSINQQMYLSGSRSTPKMCVIEEAWSLLSGANAHAKAFINTGYRTARKFGGSFATVTQGMADFFANAESQAAYNNSDIHITLRQGEGFDNFLQEYPTKFTAYEQRIIKDFDKSGVAGYSCAMVKAGGHTSFHRLFADPHTRACLSTEPHEFEFCENKMKQGVPLMDAIELTAQHFYGAEIEEFEAKLKAMAA
ncbi:type IV secretion system protein TraC [Moritella viscosa]|uniref:type IV secretion system protein TraC n=1 Tax=Moritella viscosa TaxID=80854 RepID=UPI000919A500|nr:type IV secretion system protein TraC [Moritella viscosa]SGZ09581.1 Conjugative transfer protein TraC [Moritella viscosa]